jgi:putative Holliday junction resolvase
VVLGLPLSMSGEDSSQTEKVREFRTKLENKLKSNSMQDVELIWQDERLTTRQAEKILIEGDVKRKDRKKYIDKQAAVLILQTYLDRN